MILNYQVRIISEEAKCRFFVTKIIATGNNSGKYILQSGATSPGLLRAYACCHSTNATLSKGLPIIVKSHFLTRFYVFKPKKGYFSWSLFKFKFCPFKKVLIKPIVRLKKSKCLHLFFINSNHVFC